MIAARLGASVCQLLNVAATGDVLSSQRRVAGPLAAAASRNPDH